MTDLPSLVAVRFPLRQFLRDLASSGLDGTFRGPHMAQLMPKDAGLVMEIAHAGRAGYLRYAGNSAQGEPIFALTESGRRWATQRFEGYA